MPADLCCRRALAWGATMCLSLMAQAQSLNLLNGTALRAERSPEAAAVAQLDAGQRIELLQLSGGWANVRWGARQGWVRASALDLAPAEVAPAARVDSGRRAPGATTVTLGVRTLPARSGRHALIIGVGTYRVDAARPVPALAGVRHDMTSALAMAARMQIAPENITLLRDANATRDGVRRAIEELGTRVRPGDRVFLYWSGHGSRYFDPQEDGCVETLVPHDLQDISNRQFAQWIRPLAAQADKMLVVYDACHSGGVASMATAASRGLAGGFVPKFTPGAQACLKPSNLRTRGLDSAATLTGIPGHDLVHLSSSRSDEVSFDSPASGGLATSSLLQCFNGEARDLDGSGAISIDEIAHCAQARIERTLSGQTQVDPQHLVLSGNRGFVPAWFASSPQAVPVAAQHPAPPASPAATSAAPSSPPAAVASPTAMPPTIPASPSTSNASPETLLEHLYSQRDSKRRVSVHTTADRLRIGIDAIDLSVSSSHDGYLYLAMLGSDRTSLHLLFPNDLDARNRIAAGESVMLPRSSWRLVAGGPTGRDRLLVMVTDRPRDLSTVPGAKAGPFVKALTDADGRARLHWLLGQGPADGGSTCAGGGCSDAFGAALLTLEEY